MNFDPQAAEAIQAGGAPWRRLAGEGVSVVRFAGFNDEGQFLVQLNDEETPVAALSTIRLVEEDLGTRVVIAFEKGDARYPIVLGRLQGPAAPKIESRLKVDGERVLIHAEREIELRCGEASIVLTRAGKILIRGNYVLTRSRGANKIKGAFVDIN
jgi:hypothetical protein